jgi:hypothetical protein
MRRVGGGVVGELKLPVEGAFRFSFRFSAGTGRPNSAYRGLLVAGVEEVDPELALGALGAVDGRLDGLVLVDREVGVPAARVGEARDAAALDAGGRHVGTVHS